MRDVGYKKSINHANILYSYFLTIKLHSTKENKANKSLQYLLCDILCMQVRFFSQPLLMCTSKAMAMTKLEVLRVFVRR